MLAVLAGYALVQTYPELIALFASPDLIATVERGQLWTEGLLNIVPSSVLSVQILTNNIVVSLFAYCAGFLFGLGTLYILGLNGLMLGAVFAFVSQHGLGQQLLSFIVAHGCVELSVMCLSGAAGAAVGEALIRPGEAARIESFRIAALHSGKLLVACALLLVGAGAIEGYVSPDPRFAPWCAHYHRRGLLAFHGRAALRSAVWPARTTARLVRTPLHAPRAAQRLVLREHRLFEHLCRGRHHRGSEALQQQSLRRGARLVFGGGQRDPRILPGARLGGGQRSDLAAAYTRDHHQVRRGEQPHGTRQLIGDVGVVEVGEQHDESAVLEERAYAHGSRRRIRLSGLHRQLLEQAAHARHARDAARRRTAGQHPVGVDHQTDAVVTVRHDLAQP